MANHLVALAGNLVKSINPSLLSSPPPSTEESGHDVCYFGPNGEEDYEHIIYCKDLPMGMRAMVGSWYIEPERHAIEYVAFVTISIFTIRMLLPSLTRYPAKQAHQLDPPLLIKIATCFIYFCQLGYKINGYPGKILFMAMPCNVLWTMWTALCVLPLKPQIMHIMHQLIISYTILSVVAVATPDLSDLKMWMEVPFFFTIHIAQIANPIYFLMSGRTSVLPSSGGDGMVYNFLKWWILACAYFALFYFGVAVPLSLVFGINLNYMLSPPPAPADLFVSGPNFRLQSTLCCAAAFFFSQFSVTAVAVFTNSNGKATATLKKKL